MSADKPDENISDYELNYHHQMVLVATYVEYVVLVAYIFCSREIGLDVRQVLPSGIFSHVIPSLKCSRDYKATCGGFKVLKAEDIEAIYRLARG